MRKTTGGRTWLALLAGVAVLAGCSAQYRDHGYVPPAEDLAEVEVGDTRESVRETIGAPTTSALADESGYYYVSSRMRHFAWRAPEEVSREIVAVSFSDAGTVTNVERYGLEDGVAVPLERRVTESGGSRGVLRQLLSRLGGFSPGAFLED